MEFSQNLGFGLTFADLHDLDGLKKLDKIFQNFLAEHGIIMPNQREELIAGRDYSEFLINIAPIFDDFLAELFNIKQEVTNLRLKHHEFDIIYECKRKFVQRIAVKKYPESKLAEIHFTAVSESLSNLFGSQITQDKFAKTILEWQLLPDKYASELDLAAQYAAYMVHSGSNSILFSLPQVVNNNNLLNPHKIKQYDSQVRYGFDYFAPELTTEQALNNAHYCIYCHKQGKDSCSKGFMQHTSATHNQEGCPLKQKISEMNYVKAKGFNLAALAIIVIDNPMVAATGHRICNDCMNACIYQKQDPVNVPLVESDILNNVLELPFGLEIYLLLTSWNPLNIAQPLPKEATGYNVLVAGLGPAGFSVAYYLLRDGHNVTAIEGLKISPLQFNHRLPIKYWHNHKQQLSERVPQGFGGVAEYGITSRWDKNNLTILRLILERWSNYKAYGGVRLGSNITKAQAFELGFDHIALCTGAGSPKLAQFENFLAKGVKTASDFLMNLQSGGAFLEDNINNLTIRMPIIVIGCGLTAVDAAVEALNYYPLQVEKFLKKYEQLGEAPQPQWSEEEKIIAEEFITHAKLFRKQKNKAQIREILITQLGGATICYRGDLKNSPAYKLNTEEIMHAMAAGVVFIENVIPAKINIDQYGYCQAVDFGNKTLVAKTVVMAVGTEQQNIEGAEAIATNYSYFGDCNPLFAGSVVKALASSKYGYQAISEKLKKKRPNFPKSHSEFIAKLDDLLVSVIKKVNILADNIVELIIHSPLAAKNFKAGQFFRLQNYGNDMNLPFEPIALTGAYSDLDKGLISLIIIEIGQSTKLCRQLRAGEQIVLMGPTGKPTEILQDKIVMLVGGGLGNAVLFSIGKALKENGCRVIYIAGYKQVKDRFYQQKIEAAADIVIWSCEEQALAKNREQDISIKGNVIDALKISNNIIALSTIDRIISIGSAQMMTAVKEVKKELFQQNCELICSINSPMQCMMKGICGQCVQQVFDERNYIFTCSCQDQNAEIIDFANLTNRLQQNSLQEKIAGCT